MSPKATAEDLQEDAHSLEERRRFIDFAAEDVALLVGLRETFASKIDRVVDAFYEHLVKFEGLHPLLSDPGTMQRLKAVQRSYLLSLTREDHGDAYLAERLQIGVVHERIGLLPQWYLGGYCILMEQLCPLVMERYGDDPQKSMRASLALFKLVNLDSQLILKAYFETRQQKALEKSEQLAAVGELAASIAHEVRNPLAGMKGALEVLHKYMDGDSSKAEILEEVVAQIDRLEFLVRDLLSYARPSPMSRQRVNLHRLLDRVLRYAHDSNGDAGQIEVTSDFAGNTEGIEADPQQLEQMFLNLIQNATQAMDGKGTLGVTTRRTSSTVEIVFSDSGDGVPPANLKRIFQPFFTTRHRGSGLGLAIVKKIVENHGGDVKMKSEVGRGTAVTITLPAEGES